MQLKNYRKKPKRIFITLYLVLTNIVPCGMNCVVIETPSSFLHVISNPSLTDLLLNVQKVENDPMAAASGIKTSNSSFICLKFARRGCHIWPRIRWRGTFIAPATSFSLFLSLLWAIQGPKQQNKQCCTFSLQVFTLWRNQCGGPNRLLQSQWLRL